MTLPTTTAKLGPGTLKIGLTASMIDCSCLVNNASITADKDEGDATTKLCGDVRPGTVEYTFSLSGNMDTDIGTSTGIFALSQTAAGTVVDFEFTPQTSKVTKAVGKLTLDPLDFGADEAGADLTSDFEFTLVGKPTYTYGGGLLMADEQSADADALVDA